MSALGKKSSTIVKKRVESSDEIEISPCVKKNANLEVSLQCASNAWSDDNVEEEV
jgi:hypothetical protein